MKWDGYRAQLLKDGPRVRLISRNLKDLTANYPQIPAAAVGLTRLDAIIDGVVGFLSGDVRSIQRELEQRMREAAAEERFEEAARYRNRLFAIESLAERQAADKRAVGTIDVIGLAVEGERAAVQLFPLRDGKMVDRFAFHLENVAGQDRATILESFCVEP